MPQLASTAARLLIGVTAAALMSGCIKRNAPSLVTADSAAQGEQAQSVALSSREDVARRWAAAYAANPNDKKAALNYARSLKAQGLTDQALDILKRAYEATKDPEIASELGRLAMEKGDLVAAAPALDAALNAAPGDWRLLSAQGALHARKGDHKKAQDRFLAALAQNPGSPSIINNLALSYAMDGRKADAEQLLRTALSRGADSDRMVQNLARLQGEKPENAAAAALRGPVPQPASHDAPASAQVALSDAALRPRVD